MALPGQINPFVLDEFVGSTYQIEDSLRFRGAQYLSRTMAGAGTGNETVSYWIKLGSATDSGAVMGRAIAAGSSELFTGHFGSLLLKRNGSSGANTNTTAYHRDPSAWYHVVLATTPSGSEIFINGISRGTSGDATTFSAAGLLLKIGAFATIAGNELNGYLADFHFVDGQALAPTDFGEFNADGVWVPIDVTGLTYGTNGWYLDFSDPSNIGADHSGNGNNFTATGFTTSGTGTDVMSDTPTTNWCTLNPLDATLTLSNGNLDWSAPSSVERGARGTFAVSTGKRYFEYITKGQTFELVGWAAQAQDNNSTMPTGVGASTWSYYLFDLKTYNNATASAVYGTAASSGDTIMVALDLDNSKIYWGRNGTWFNSGDPATGTNAAYTNVSGTLFPWVQQYNQTSSINFGQRAFAYTPPAGFSAINTSNLPSPTIKDGSQYFDAVLYNGDGGTSNSVTGLSFQADVVWGKSRSNALPHNIFDVVRGFDKQLDVNDTAAEVDRAGDAVTVNSTGFTLDATYCNINNSSTTNVAWAWKAGGSGSSNTAGSITSTVSANPSAGFSIVTYTGTGANATVGHGLGVAPKMLIVKRRDSAGYSWIIGHSSIGWNNYIVFATDAAGPNSAIWQDTAPTSTVFSVGTNAAVNGLSATFVAYCFSEVEGYSKFGSYTGNSSSDGSFVYLGFRPSWLLVKRYNTTGAWFLMDAARNTYNVVDDFLYPNSSDSENSGSFGEAIDFLSNGFKCRTTSGFLNGSGDSYIYAAFAEHPFGGSNVSPATAR